MAAANVDCPQCLVDFFGDVNGLNWHHRLLLFRGSDQKWLWVTPDGEVQLGDLAVHRVIPLRRGEPIPERVADEAYIFDEVSPEEFAQYVEEAKALANILNIDVGPSVPGLDRWFVNDPLSEAFGEEVPAAAMQNPDTSVRRGDFGLVGVGDAWTTCVRVAPARSFDDYRREVAKGKGKDTRLLGDFRDAAGRRFLSFGEAVEKLSEEEMSYFPLRGPRAARSFVLSLRSSNQDFTSHHEFFVRKSGLGEKASVAREHRHLHEALRLAVEFDQYDISNGASWEYIVRRLVQIEAAVKRNPRQPDFEGLESVMDSAVDESGTAVVADFAQWVSDRQKAEANMLKAGRLWREERQAESKRRTGGQASTGAAA